jgi:hypothetical protein
MLVLFVCSLSNNSVVISITKGVRLVDVSLDFLQGELLFPVLRIFLAEYVRK